MLALYCFPGRSGDLSTRPSISRVSNDSSARPVLFSRMSNGLSTRPTGFNSAPTSASDMSHTRARPTCERVRGDGRGTDTVGAMIY